MFFKKFFTNPLVVVLVLLLVFGILFNRFDIIIKALGITTINCDSNFEILANILINSVRDVDAFMVTLSNLEFLQDMVGIPNNGYNIDYNDWNGFFQLFFLSQELSVELIDGVWVNCIKVNDIIYTVHPSFIVFILQLLEGIFF